MYMYNGYLTEQLFLQSIMHIIISSVATDCPSVVTKYVSAITYLQKSLGNFSFCSLSQGYHGYLRRIWLQILLTSLLVIWLLPFFIFIHPCLSNVWIEAFPILKVYSINEFKMYIPLGPIASNISSLIFRPKGTGCDNLFFFIEI